MRQRQPRVRHLLTALVISLAVSTFGSGAVSAHADLVRAEPAIDGLVAAAPAQLRLVFSEEVYVGEGSPSVQLLNEQGEGQGTSLVGSGVLPDRPREVLVNIGGLDPGTYTVVWSVRSATDGHTLGGTYAFRVGGGVPPGAATVAGETPAPWAVALRWLTFLGTALAAGGFLFGRIVLRGMVSPSDWSVRRSRLILGGIAVALLATLAEPVLQTIFPPEGVEGSLEQMVRGLPTGWWLRPIALGPLLLLAVVLAVPLRGQTPRVVAWVGLALSLVALLGLALTSHAAGRESWRSVALVANVLHQWSTALWVGGLAHLALWWPSRRDVPHTGHEPLPDEAAPPTSPVRRFSAIALVLVAVALVTGVINAGFVVPTIAGAWTGILNAEVVLPAPPDLWASGYSIVLLIKLAVLLIPLALAVYNRAELRRGLTTLAGTLRRSVRIEAIAVLAVVLGGSILALLAPPVESRGELTEVRLVARATSADGQPAALVHLAVDPARSGRNLIGVRLTDDAGAPLASSPDRAVSLTLTSLSHPPARQTSTATAVESVPAAYAVEGLDLSLEGWWRIDVALGEPGQAPVTAPFYLLLPDPNIHGSDAPPDPPSDPAALALFERGLDTMTAWRSVRWTQWLGSGQDVLVRADLAVTTDAQGHGTGFSLESENYTSVTVGERQFLRRQGGGWLEQPANKITPPREWRATYEGATNIQLGATETINGEPAQVVTFYSPEKQGQSEAWFAWWVGQETGTIYRITMVARLHYMVEEYRDINAPFEITPPTSTIGRTAL